MVLCGGQGRRQGGADKGLLPCPPVAAAGTASPGAPRRMVDAVLAGVVPQVARVIISANRNLATYQALGHPVVADTVPGYLGPLAGVAAALPLVQTPWVCWTPCDVPGAPSDWVAVLASAAVDEPQALYLQVNGKAEPLFALVRSDWACDKTHGIAAYLSGGGRSVLGWVNSGRYFAVTLAGPAAARAFKNHNNPDD